MRYLYVGALFVLGMVLLGGQHTHSKYEVHGVADKYHNHTVSEVYGAAQCSMGGEVGCGMGIGHTHR